MILQSLCEYYQRKKQDLAPLGFEEKEIQFIIVINKNGEFINLENNAEIEGKKIIIKPNRVPKASGRSGGKSYATAYCLWDHYGYIAAQPKLAKPTAQPTQKDIDLAEKQHHSFKILVKALAEDLPDDLGVQAVNKFLNDTAQIDNLKQHEVWQECIKKNGTNLSFRVAGATNLVCQSEYVLNWVKNQPHAQNDITNSVCLLTGEETEVVRLHENIAGVSQKPAPLASINNAAYNSFNKDKAFNFPVSTQASFEYATALNHLLRKGSNTKFRIANTTYVCWSKKQNQLEKTFPSIFTDNPDNPEQDTNRIKSLFSSIHNGAYIDKDGSTEFFVLALTPNSARIAISYWKTGTVKEFSEHIAQWFEDLLIEGNDHFGIPSLKKLLRHTALQYKDDNVPPNLAPSVVRSILSGQKLPTTFLQAAIRRIKAEQGNVDFYRVSIIKAYLNRKFRSAKPQQRKLTMSLNKDEKRIGYSLGRLFAALEKLQQDAQPGINATIRDRYYSSASCTPKSVFGTLMRLSTHHLKKLENPSWKINAEKRMGEIMESIAEFPSHLDLENQGLFAVGYYHQKQSFYKKTKTEGEIE